MNVITKVSDITANDLAEYIRLDEVTTADTNALNTFKGIAIALIKKYTGVADLDTSEDFVICVFIQVQDMWDNRTLYVDKPTLNKTVESILGLHSVNLL